MIEQFKRRFNSLYWHQFALTAGMVLLTLLLLGVSFFTLSYGTTTADKRGEMRTRAELIAQVSGVAVPIGPYEPKAAGKTASNAEESLHKLEQLGLDVSIEDTDRKKKA